jgi:predicted transcriptional regulator
LQDIDENLDKMIKNNQLTNNKRAGLSSTKYQNQIAWRRNKIKELITRGYTQFEISRELHISQPTISRDIQYLEKGFAKSPKNYSKRLYSTFESTMMGYDELIKKLWTIIDSKRTDDKERIKAITLLAQYYRQRLELIRSEPELILNKNRMSELQVFNI